MKKKSSIHDLIDRVNKNTIGIYKRDSELIVTLPAVIANIIKSNRIYLSEFVIAKVKGLIKTNEGHPEITDKIFKQLPKSLSNPFRIYEDNRTPNRDKYIFIKIDPNHQIVVEVCRPDSGKTEINTIIPLNLKKRKQLEKNLKAVFF